jgi:hypothetical protein
VVCLAIEEESGSTVLPRRASLFPIAKRAISTMETGYITKQAYASLNMEASNPSK